MTAGDATRPWTPAVHALLEHLAPTGCAPRPLEPLSGDVLADAAAVDEAALRIVGRLIRTFHDATVGWTAPDGAAWQRLPGTPAGGDVICHNDLGPSNTVFRDGRPVAFVDWEHAAPGPRAWDLAGAVWRFAPLCADAEPVESGRRARLLLDAYGLSERAEFLALVRERMRAVRERIRAGAEAGESPWLERWGTEHSERPLADRTWVARHRRTLERAIGSG